MNSDPKRLLTKESLRIEEDALHSMKSHYNAAVSLNQLHLWLGLPTAIIAAIAGGASLGGEETFAAALAFLTAVLAGAMTFLKPSKKAEQHKSSASRYHSLRNNLRRFRDIEVSTNEDFNLLKNNLDNFAEQLNELNEVCPAIPRAAYEKAKRDIDKGRAKYQADEVNNDSQ